MVRQNLPLWWSWFPDTAPSWRGSPQGFGLFREVVELLPCQFFLEQSVSPLAVPALPSPLRCHAETLQPNYELLFREEEPGIRLVRVQHELCNIKEYKKTPSRLPAPPPNTEGVCCGVELVPREKLEPVFLKARAVEASPTAAECCKKSLNKSAFGFLQPYLKDSNKSLRCAALRADSLCFVRDRVKEMFHIFHQTVFVYAILSPPIAWPAWNSLEGYTALWLSSILVYSGDW